MLLVIKKKGILVKNVREREVSVNRKRLVVENVSRNISRSIKNI